MTNKDIVISYDLGVRTPGERLWLARKAAGLTSYEAASLAGVGRNAYREAERDENRREKGLKTGLGPVSKPSLALLCALARRRSGKPLALIAGRLGISRITYLAWERAGNPRVKEFWARAGFWFPRK